MVRAYPRRLFVALKHNDTQHLHDLLKRKRTQFKRVLIVTESLFSMDGDFAPISDIIRLKKDFDAELLIDEAHATGVFGDRGQGLITSTQAPDIEYIVGTFGKAFGSSGAYLLCNNTIKDHIINHCRSFIYSTAMPPLIAAITLQQLQHIKTMDQEREKLINTAQYFKEQLNTLGYTMLGNAHIISVIVGDEDAAVSLSRKLKEASFWALPIRPPTVAKGTSRIRLSFTAHHKKDMLAPLIEFLKRIMPFTYKIIGDIQNNMHVYIPGWALTGSQCFKTFEPEINNKVIIETYDPNEFTQNLNHFLRQYNIHTIHLTGFSMGGLVASLFAKEYPKVLNSLHLISVRKIYPLLEVKLLKKQLKADKITTLSHFYKSMFSKQNHNDCFISELESNCDLFSIETLSDDLDFLANTHLDLTLASNHLNNFNISHGKLDRISPYKDIVSLLNDHNLTTSLRTLKTGHFIFFD